MLAHPALRLAALWLCTLSACAHRPPPEGGDGELLRVYPTFAQTSQARPEAVVPPSADGLVAPTGPARAAAQLPQHEVAMATAAEVAPATPVPEAHIPRLGTLSIEVRAGRKNRNCAVRVAGTDLGRAPLTELEVEPGAQMVVVQCGKKRRARKNIEISAGAHETLIFLKSDFVRSRKRRRRAQR